MVLLLSFVLAMLITMALIPPLMRSAQRLQFVDLPDERKVHSGAIPRVGGIAIAIGAMVPMLAWLPLDQELMGLTLGLAVILVFGVWDDRADLDYRLKFFGQGIAIAAIIFYGNVHITTVPFLGIDELPGWASVALTMFVLLAVTNAINLSDGLDGLAAGTTLLSLGLIVFLAYGVELPVVSILGLAVMGSILGFLRFNTHPARIFMGDGGSQFLGLAVGVLALMLTQGQRTDFSPLLPLLVLGLPLLDTAMVMVQRIAEGRSPFSADRNHIHHRLLALGLSHYEVVVAVYVLQAGLAATAYVLRYAHDESILAVYGVFCAAVAGLLYFAQNCGWRVPHFSQRRLNQLKEFGREGLFARLAHGYVLVAMPVFMVAGAVFASGISGDIALLSLILLLLCGVEWIRNRQARISWTERGVIYIVAAVLLYLTETGHGPLPLNQLFFGALAIAVVLGFRYSADAGFAATPSDFLIIFFALALPIIPQAQELAPLWTAYLPKLVVLYYGVEMALSRLSGRRHMVRTVTMATLGIILLRGLL